MDEIVQPRLRAMLDIMDRVEDRVLDSPAQKGSYETRTNLMLQDEHRQNQKKSCEGLVVLFLHEQVVHDSC